MTSISKLGFPLLTLILVAALAAPAASAEITLPDDPAGTVTAIADAVGDGHPEVLWQALPATWQADVVSLTQEFANSMDPAVYDGAFAMVQRAVRVVRAKKPLLMQSSMMQMAGDDRAATEQKFDQAMAALDTIASSDIATLDGLRKLDWNRFLRTTGGALIERLDATAEDGEPSPTAKLQGVSAETVSRDGDHATVRVMAPGEEPETVELTRIEGRWVPTEMATDWSDKIAQARTGLASQDQNAKAQTTSQMMMVLATANGVLDQIEQAQTPEQLDAVIGGLMGGLGGMMTMGMPGDEPATAPDAE